VLLTSILVGLILAETIVRVWNLDWNFIRDLLYYQGVDVQCHVLDTDPRVMFRLKPGSVCRDDSYKSTINGLGFRGNERSIEKNPGSYRIVCIGGSNVYGAGLNDDETWPAQLENKLNNSCTTRFEVWNLGVPAYVGIQMATVAEEAISQYDPDLVILALSNKGARAFLSREQVVDYFDTDPYFWELLMPPEHLKFPPLIPYQYRIALIRHWRFFRYGFLAITARSEEIHDWRDGYEHHEAINISSVRDFLKTGHGDVPVMVFLCPAESSQTLAIDDYTEGSGVPVLDLEADEMPDEYREIHPPPYVMTWYADNLFGWLKENGLLPPDCIDDPDETPIDPRINAE